MCYGSTKSIIILSIAVIALKLSSVESQYRDERCKCVFPSPLTNSSKTPGNSRQIYIANIPANKCNCIDIRDVIPIHEDIHDCSKCECKYQYRNTFTIKVVVIFIIIVISSLFLYMIFLICLDPMINKPGTDFYTQYHNEGPSISEVRKPSFEEESTAVINCRRTSSRYMGQASDNVLYRVGQHKDKWKGQVQEQRKNVYDKHTMLN